MDHPVRGSGNIIRCYPGACSEFNIGLFGYGCQPLANRLGNNCSLCRPGLYLPAETTYSSCLACLPGQHAPRSGMSSCESCSAGRYQKLKQKATCLMCPPGKFGNVSLACINVPRGSFPIDCLVADGHGCAATKLCPEGSFCNGTVLRPVQCLPGQTTAVKGLASCSKCPVGKAGTGGKCHTCQGNSVTDRPGYTRCKSCIGKYANPGKTYCAVEQKRGSSPTPR